MLDEALGREDLAAQFRAAADELDAEFEAAMESQLARSLMSPGTPK